MQGKVTRRFRITIPEKFREKAKISVGNTVDIRYEDGKVVVEKMEDSREEVMAKTAGSWAKHPVFGKMKNSVEIVRWLRSSTGTGVQHERLKQPPKGPV